MKTPLSSHLRPTIAALAIFFLALLPRLGALDRYVTPDELHWVDRSIRFSQALARGDLADTVQAGHPGVTTLWLGSLGLTLQRVFNPAAPVPGQLPEFAPQNADAMRYLAQFLGPMRWPVIIITAFNIVLLFWLLSRVIDRRAAFLAAALVALDPFAIALGGILHVDSLLMTFCLASLAALSVALNRPSPQPLSSQSASDASADVGRGWRVAPGEGWLIVSGVLAGLAMLSKSPAIVLVPVALIVIVLDAWRKRASFGAVIRSGLIWGLSAAAIFIALYPAMWVAPGKALQSLTQTAEKHSEVAHAVNYFFGNNERDPGAAFYLAAMAYRSTPVLWWGLIAFGLLIARGRTDEAKRLQSTAWPYWAFAIVFTGLITLGAKKLDRYMLPTLEALNMIGAIGLAFVLDWLVKRAERSRTTAQSKRVLPAISMVLTMIITAAQFIAVWPLTLRAYNPVLGGYAGASKALPVGGGESAEVGQALAASPYATSVIAAADLVGTAPFFKGALVPTTDAGFTQADYALFTAADFQLTPDDARGWIGRVAPVLTVTVQNQPFAWLYPNRWLTADRQRLIDQRQPTDAVLMDYAAALPGQPTALLTHELSDAQARDLVQQLAATYQRIFVFHYGVVSRHTLSALFDVLDTYAINLDQWSSPLGDGALYALPDQLTFATQPTPLNGGTTFDDRLQLTRAELTQAEVQPGQTIGVIGDWLATGPDAQVIVSLVDDAQHQWSSGVAGVPMTSDASTPRPRRVGVPVPITLPPGSYHLIMNVVDVASGSPLQTRRADGILGGTDWPLGTIMIDPGQTLINPATRKPSITLNVDLGHILRAIGSDKPPRPVISGDPWTLPMEWLALADHMPEYDVQWSIVTTATGSIAYSTTLPLNVYSTDQWRKGDLLQSKYDFRLPTTVADGQYSLEFQVLDRATHQSIEPHPTTLTSIKVASRSRTFTAPALAYPTDYRFDQLTTLIGANTDRAGGTVTVTLYWQAQAITSTNYTVFVQLTRPDGQSVGQIDHWQIGGDMPTAAWAVDQIVGDAYAFDVPDAEYQVWVGVYNAADSQRLPAFDAQGRRLPQDQALIMTLK